MRVLPALSPDVKDKRPSLTQGGAQRQVAKLPAAPGTCALGSSGFSARAAMFYSEILIQASVYPGIL